MTWPGVNTDNDSLTGEKFCLPSLQSDVRNLALGWNEQVACALKERGQTRDRKIS